MSENAKLIKCCVLKALDYLPAVCFEDTDKMFLSASLKHFNMCDRVYVCVECSTPHKL